MKFWLHPDVSGDLESAFEWYEDKHDGLGYRFV
jgi:hypothetical protein